MEKLHIVNERILKKVTPSRVAARLEVMEAFAYDVLDLHKKELPDGIYVNMAILTSLIRSYFLDIERYKFFHKLKLVETYKIASYTTKWIVRDKPLQFIADDPDFDKYRALLYINEIFAFEFGVAISNINPARITPELFEESIYTFKYRHISEDTLTLWFKALGGEDSLHNG